MLLGSQYACPQRPSVSHMTCRHFSLSWTLSGLDWIPTSVFTVLEWNCAFASVTNWAFGKEIVFDFCHLLHCVICLHMYNAFCFGKRKVLFFYFLNSMVFISLRKKGWKNDSTVKSSTFITFIIPEKKWSHVHNKI